MALEFTNIVTEESQLRDVMGFPSQLVINKAIPELDENCCIFIAKSPFILIASSDAQGNLDVSPKGDPAGFVKVLDEHTLAIPDRRGNRRADTLVNIIQNPEIALIFMIPGIKDTLRINGRAKVVADRWVREQMMMQGKTPDFAIVVTVREAYVHCAKCIIRSDLWSIENADVEGVPTLARMIIDHAGLDESEDSMQVMVDEGNEELY